MEELKKIEDLADHAKEYLNTRIDAAKLVIAEKLSNLAAIVIAGWVVSLVFLLCIVFASAAASYGLGVWLGKTWLGFLLVGSFYFLLGILVWAAKGRLIRVPVMNAIIHQLFKTEDKDEND